MANGDGWILPGKNRHFLVFVEVVFCRNPVFQKLKPQRAQRNAKGFVY
jgi:hypothetical protein